MIPTLPKQLQIPDVPRYVRTQYGQDVSKITAYNWVKIGRVNKAGQRIKLKTIEKTMPINPAGGPRAHRYTTNVWVDDFIKQTTDWV